MLKLYWQPCLHQGEILFRRYEYSFFLCTRIVERTIRSIAMASVQSIVRSPFMVDKYGRSVFQIKDSFNMIDGLINIDFFFRYIGPLKEEAASWAEKLKEVAEVLELWLEVQDLWQYLEAVFSNSVAVRVNSLV